MPCPASATNRRKSCRVLQRIYYFTIGNIHVKSRISVGQRRGTHLNSLAKCKSVVASVKLWLARGTSSEAYQAALGVRPSCVTVPPPALPNGHSQSRSAVRSACSLGRACLPQRRAFLRRGFASVWHRAANGYHSGASTPPHGRAVCTGPVHSTSGTVNVSCLTNSGDHGRIYCDR